MIERPGRRLFAIQKQLIDPLFPSVPTHLNIYAHHNPTCTYNGRSQTYDDNRTYDDDDARTNRTSRTYDDARTNPTYDDDARTNRTSRTYDDARTNPTYDDDARTNRTSRTYDDAPTHRSSRSYDDAQTQHTSRSYDDAQTNQTYEDDNRTYDDDARTYDDDRTYDDAASEARTYEEGASVYDDGRSGYDDGSAAYDDGGSPAYDNGQSATYDDGRSAAYSNSGGRSEAHSNHGGQSEAYSNSGGRSKAYSNSGGKSEAYTNSGGRSEGYSGARSYSGNRSAAYDNGRSDTQSAGYDNAHSAGYDDAHTYDERSEVGSRVQSLARSEGQEDASTQYSLEDDGVSGTSVSSSLSPEEILASLHAKTLNPITFERKVLSTVEEQTERSSSQLSRQSSFRLGPGSDILHHAGRSGSHARGVSDSGSLFSPSTHGSYLSLSPAVGQTQPLNLFSPLLQPPKSETPTLKEKESMESLGRHPSASLGRRAGELIAFFESGAATGPGSRPISLTKSDASFVSAASASGERPIPAGPRSSFGSSSYGQGASSPGKMSTSLSTSTRTFGSGSGSKSASGSGSYTGSDLGSTVSSPFARLRGTGVGLGFDVLFLPSFPAARSVSPFRPLSPTKSMSITSGSYASGTQKERDKAGSETYRTTGSARSKTNRSDTYRSETNHSDTYRSETNRSDTYRSESNASNTYRSGGNDAYPTNGSDTYRSGTGPSESVTIQSTGSARSRSVASKTYRSNAPTYTGAGSDTYCPGSVSGPSRSVASESYNSNTYMTGTGSDAGVSGFLSSMYPPASESGTRTVTGSRAGSHSRSGSAYSQGRSDGGFSQERAETPTQGRSEGGFSQGSSAYGRRSATYQVSEAYTQGTTTYVQDSGTYTQGSNTYVPATSAYTKDTYTQGSDTYTQGSRTESSPPPPVPPKSPTTPRATRTQRSETPVMPTTPKTPNPLPEDKFADGQDRSPQAGKKTPYSNTMPLTPKTIGSSMTPRTQAGVMTPRTPGGRLGKALSEASTAPTSAEGLMRQHMSREIVNSVPVPSESEAIVLGHNGQDPIRINALWYLNVHAPPPFEWLCTQAVLYPNVLILTWIAPAGGRGVVTLDLVKYTEVRSAPSPSHPSARDDVGIVAARLQSPELAETLCLFQLLYADGVERLGTDTAGERVRWVGAIREVLAMIARTPVRAVTERSASPSGSSLQRSPSVRSSSSEGFSSTHFVPPFDNIPDMASMLSRQSSFAMPRQTADNMSVASLIPPARTPSLRCTASMADMELKADIDRALHRSNAGGVPVTVTSGASQGESTIMSPPPGRRHSGAHAPSETSGLYTPTASATDRPHSSFYASSNVSACDDTYAPTDTKQSTVRGVQIEADTLSFRGSNSASMLSDSQDAFSTGYGLRSESRISTATYSCRQTPSAVSPLSSISRSGRLRRPKRDCTQSLSPEATDRRISISPVDGYSTASKRPSVLCSGPQVTFRSYASSLGYESTGEGSHGPLTSGSIGYEICETSDMSEFTIDQRESRICSRTATSDTTQVISPTKGSEEFITAEGSAVTESQFDTVQSCLSTGFETVTAMYPQESSISLDCNVDVIGGLGLDCLII
ncbi:hypothetical protein RhiJN_00519 [Ceratobasidium sp. AG-Ba]|nr:hypothetical protein RhiJN_00519 [Ceratobasidium sp. AG-Ba]